MKTALKVIAFAIVITLLSWFGYQYTLTSQAAQRSEAVNSCMEIARFVYEDGDTGSNSLMVVEDIYNQCLTLKGYQKP